MTLKSLGRPGIFSGLLLVAAHLMASVAHAADPNLR
jgi:hypothetical protein